MPWPAPALVLAAVGPRSGHDGNLVLWCAFYGELARACWDYEA
jgi:hypothetical protein